MWEIIFRGEKMAYIDFELEVLKKIFENKELVKENIVYKNLQEKIESKVKEFEKSVGNIDDFKQILYLMEVKSEILLIQIYLDAIDEYEDLEKKFCRQEINKYLQNFSLVELYDEMYKDSYKEGLMDY